MKNFRLKPLERNNYFYGKLLTVRDFQREQEYNNEKAILKNKFIYGSGVINGLQIIKVDDYTISLEPGVAVDSHGREIIVASPITRKLSSIEGFPKEGYHKEAYLALNYNEEGKEQVHSIEDDESLKEEYNRISEEYKLEIIEDLDESDFFDIDELYNKKILFEDNMLKVYLQIPRFTKINQIFEAKLTIFPKINLEFLKINFELKLENILNLNKENQFKIDMELKELKEGVLYKEYIPLKTSNKESKNVNFFIEDIKIKYLEDKVEKNINLKEKIEIFKENVEDIYLKKNFDKSIDDIIRNSNNKKVFLAKLYLVQSGDTYAIEKIEQNPFEQRIYTNEFLYNLLNLKLDSKDKEITALVDKEIVEYNEEPDIKVHFNNEENLMKFKFKLPKNKIIHDKSSTGIIQMAINGNFILGKNLYSEEITHGLGLGPVRIQLALEEVSNDSYMDEEYEEQIYFGDQEVFYKSPLESKLGLYSLGAVLYPKKGTFKIGLRLQSSNKQRDIKIRWWAYKETKVVDELNKANVFVEPQQITLKINETTRFSSVVTNLEDKRVNWKIDDKKGGTIDNTGFYMAPNKKGIYKIIAESIQNPARKGIAYVKVIEEDE